MSTKISLTLPIDCFLLGFLLLSLLHKDLHNLPLLGPLFRTYHNNTLNHYRSY